MGSYTHEVRVHIATAIRIIYAKQIVFIGASQFLLLSSYLLLEWEYNSRVGFDIQIQFHVSRRAVIFAICTSDLLWIISCHNFFSVPCDWIRSLCTLRWHTSATLRHRRFSRFSISEHPTPLLQVNVRLNNQYFPSQSFSAYTTSFNGTTHHPTYDCRPMSYVSSED